MHTGEGVCTTLLVAQYLETKAESKDSQLSLTAVDWFIRTVSTVIITVTEGPCCWYTATCVVTFDQVFTACYTYTPNIVQIPVHAVLTNSFSKFNCFDNTSLAI